MDTVSTLPPTTKKTPHHRPLLASTYLGGSGDDYGYSLALDTSGNVYVTGDTDSTDFPTTSGAYDTSYNGGDSDVFVSKLDGGLTSLLASTYLGGSGELLIMVSSLTLDTSGNVYVTGILCQQTFRRRAGHMIPLYNGGYDVFVSKLDSGLTSLLASTYLGGSSIDYGNSLALDTSGNVYVTGILGQQTFRPRAGHMIPLIMVWCLCLEAGQWINEPAGIHVPWRV